MADKTIGDLPAASAIYDDDLFLLEQSGEAKNLRGALYKAYLQGFVDAASAASEEAAAALAGVRDAINNIPEGAATPIVNDLITGGTSMALSAEMGKKLKGEIDGLTYADVNAAPAWLTYGTYNVAGTDENFLAIVNSVYESMPDNSVRNIIIAFSGSHPVIGGTAFLVEIYRRSGSYGSLIAKTYGDTYHRSFRAGVWDDFRRLATTDYAVNKAGDTMTGALKVEIGGKQNIHSVNATGDIAFIQYYDTTNKKAANIGWSDTQLFYQYTHDLATWSKYNILHTGNMPSGSYTGNGSAAERQIPVGAFISKCLAIWASNGTAAFLTGGGAICRKGSTVYALGYGGTTYNLETAGNLILVTDDEALNANGVTYKYQFL